MSAASSLQGTLKFISVLGLFVGFIGEGLFRNIWALLFNIPRFELQRSRADSISRYSRWTLKVLGITTNSNLGRPAPSGLWVGNHLSYVDVLVLASNFPCSFVTSVEVRDTPVLGWITRLAGCIHVERRSREQLAEETREMRVMLQAGIPIILFPEGTSSPGITVLPFRPALFQAAIDAGVDTHAFYLKHSRSEIAYFGDHQFFKHLWRVCQMGSSLSTIHLVETVPFPWIDRKSLAARCHLAVSSFHASFAQEPGNPSYRMEPHRNCSNPG